jgi:hypothetical protein
MGSDPVVHRNDEDGIQIEWGGVLLTLRPNEHYGISGSLTRKNEEGLKEVLVHGSEFSKPFPLCVHGPGECSRPPYDGM